MREREASSIHVEPRSGRKYLLFVEWRRYGEASESNLQRMAESA